MSVYRTIGPLFLLSISKSEVLIQIYFVVKKQTVKKQLIFILVLNHSSFFSDIDSNVLAFVLKLLFLMLIRGPFGKYVAWSFFSVTD